MDAAKARSGFWEICLASKWCHVYLSAYLSALEYTGDVARIFVYSICCTAATEYLDEYHLARISKYQLIDFHHPGSDTVALLYAVTVKVRPRVHTDGVIVRKKPARLL